MDYDYLEKMCTGFAIIFIIGIFALACYQESEPEARTTQQIITDRYNSCIANSFANEVYKCQEFLKLK